MAKKKLTIDSVKEKNKKYDEYIVVEVNEEWDLEVKKEWSPVDVSSLVGEFTAQIRGMVGQTGFQEISTPYLFILVLKYFTKFGDDIPDSFEGRVRLMQELINDGVYGDIMNCFPEDQMDKVNNALQNLAEYLNEQADKYNEESSELDIENEEVKNLIQ